MCPIEIIQNNQFFKEEKKGGGSSMKRKIIIAGCSLLILLAVSSKYVFASGPKDFSEIYPVDNKFSVSEKTTFGWGEKPWIYLQLPDSGYEYDITKSFWWDPVEGGSKRHQADLILRNDAQRQVWVSFTNAKWFGSDGNPGLREAGDWKVMAFSQLFFSPNSVRAAGRTGFTVTPEPISSVLFLLGSGVLVGVSRIRKRKQVNSFKKQ